MNINIEYMNINDIECELLKLCKNKSLSNNEKEFVDYIFSNKILNVEYEDNEFLLSSSFFGNSDMINILKKYNADTHIYDNKPYRLALQNNNINCIQLLS